MNQIKGYIYALISGFIFGFTPILAKLSFAHGANPIEVAVLRFVLILPVLFFILKKQGIPLQLSKKEFYQITILTLGGTASTTILLYSSYVTISVGLATTLHFIYPLAVACGGILFLHEKISQLKLIALATALGGIFLLYQPGQVAWQGVGLALTSGITYAFYMVYIVSSSLYKMPIFKLTFWVACYNIVFISLYGAATEQLHFQLDITAWILTLAVALFTCFGGVALLQLAIRFIGPTNTAIISTIEPFVGIVLGIVILNEPVSWRIWSGCILISLAVILLILNDRKTIQKQKTDSCTP